MTNPGSFASELIGARPDPFASLLGEGDLATRALAHQLQVFVRATRAYYLLEVGTGTGYLGLHMLASLGNTGRLDTIEPDPATAREAEANFSRHGFADRSRVHGAPPPGVLPGLNGPYDLAVVHGTPAAVSDSHEDLVRLVRVGGSLFFTGAGVAAEELEAGGEGPASKYLARLAQDDRLLSYIPPDLAQALAVRTR